jgi:GntR family transcriptional regulator, carbon starvation induced regulator
MTADVVQLDAWDRPPPSRSAWVTAQLREAIVAGELPPGARLRPRDLELRYGVSATPLREAIQTLAAERLLTVTPQRGAVVALLDPEELGQIYELRLLLEPTAVKRSLARADDGWAAEVDAAYRRLVAAEAEPGRLVGAAAFELHNRFHRAIRARCDSPWLLHLIDELVLHSERYRRLRGRPDEFERIHAEHAALHRACLVRDRERVLTLSTAHLARTLQVIRTRLAPRAGPPAP